MYRVRRVRLVAVAFVSCLLSWQSLKCQAGEFQVGFARHDITPEQPMWMSGYGARDRPADGKVHELWAKAMMIQDASQSRFVLITLDLVGVDRETTSRITHAAQQRFGLPRSAIAISTTHTHSGPVVGENLKAMYDLDHTAWQQVSTYTDFLVNAVVDLIGKASKDLRPAKLEWTVGRAHFGTNRRNNPEAEVPALRTVDRLRGPVDHDVPILVIREDLHAARTEDSTILGIICGYACHATVLSGYQWCGDWPGFTQLKLEQRFPGATAMVWAGCGADINPLPRRDVELARQYGAEIDTAVANALAKPPMKITGSIRSQYREISLPFASLPTKTQLEQTLESSNRYEVGRARLLLQQFQKREELSPTYPYPIQTIQLGNGPTWVFLGGEVVVDYALRLKFELGAGATWVAGYSNDVMAYIGSQRVIREGGYEGGGAMVYYGLPSPWADTIEDQIFDEIHRQVTSLTDRPRPARAITVAAYPNNRDLTLYRDQHGEMQQVKKMEDWQRRVADVLNNAQYVMGRMPDLENAGPLNVNIVDTLEFDKFQRKTITYQAFPGQTATADLYLPKTDKQKMPAMLALHPTSSLGKRVVAGEGPLGNRGYAVELAERGYVVLAPDYPSFGELSRYDLHTDAYLSGTMTAIVNHRRAIDVLQSDERVAADRIGAIGHSLGGHNAIFLAAFDDRIKAVVTSCGWDPFHDYYGGKLSGWSSDRYMPRIRELFATDPDEMPFDFPELIASLAPRAFFSSSPLKDSNFRAAGVKAVQTSLQQVYELYGAEENLIIVYPDCEHDFPEPIRQQAYEFLDRHLLPR